MAKRNVNAAIKTEIPSGSIITEDKSISIPVKNHVKVTGAQKSAFRTYLKTGLGLLGLILLVIPALKLYTGHDPKAAAEALLKAKVSSTNPFHRYYAYMSTPTFPAWAIVDFGEYSNRESSDQVPVGVDPKNGRTLNVKLPTKSVEELKWSIKADVWKREAIKQAFQHSWNGYVEHAWGADEYHPLSGGGSNLTAAGGIGYTIVDTLDSLWLMGGEGELRRATKWVEKQLDFNKNGEWNTFETTIRILGGLLSAHYLATITPVSEYSPDPEADAAIFLNKAVDLADRLLPAFDSPSGIPWSLINLGEKRGIPDKGNQNYASLAEAASLQLEFKYLSHLTGDMIYWKKAERVTAIIRQQSVNEGIGPIYIDPRSGRFVSSEIRLGSRGDSYYEYLIKQYLQTNRQEPVYRDMYDGAMTGIKKMMINRTPREGLLYTQELVPSRDPTGANSWRIVPKQDHLVCFLGGSFLLGITEGGKREVDWMNLSEQDLGDYLAGIGIIDTCLETYKTETGLGPEIAMFWQEEEISDSLGSSDWYLKSFRTNPIDSRNILRPETVESLFLGYRLTGNPAYREAGWKIFLAFDENCRCEGGYASIRNVEGKKVEMEDKMETFWLAETLKYLYLLFDDGTSIPLDAHVFNTEAHILPVFDPEQLTKFSTMRS